MTYPDAVRRAGHADGNALFDAILDSPSGVTFTAHNYEDDFALISHADHKIALEIPEMLDELRALTAAPPRLTAAEFPIVLSVGERRAYTANDIFRDPSWRKRDVDGALRVSVEDAQALGLVDGGRARITTAAGSAEASVEITETCCPDMRPCPTVLGSTTSTTTGAPSFPVSPPTLSRPRGGATPTRAPHGTTRARENRCDT